MGTQRSHLLPDAISYKSVINDRDTGGKWKDALGSFGEKQRNDFLPDVIKYSSAISAWERVDQWYNDLRPADRRLLLMDPKADPTLDSTF